MKTILDLVQEFAGLDEAKTVARGTLPPDLERRWTELKSFYDLLMSQEGLSEEPVRRFTATEIRETVTARHRLRVSTDLEIPVVHGKEHHRCRLANLSRGGALLLGGVVFQKGTRLTLHLPMISEQEVLTTEAVVVWWSDGGALAGRNRYRMGTQFQELEGRAIAMLDASIIESLERRLLSLSPSSLDAELVRKERLVL